MNELLAQYADEFIVLLPVILFIWRVNRDRRADIKERTQRLIDEATWKTQVKGDIQLLKDRDSKVSACIEKIHHDLETIKDSIRR